MSPKDILLCSGFAVALPIGQVLFKLGADKSKIIDGGVVWKVLLNPPLLAAFAWYGVTALYWVYVLTRVPLGLAYPFSLVGAALVPILAWALFRESIPAQAWIGYGVMIIGLLMITRGR